MAYNIVNEFNKKQREQTQELLGIVTDPNKNNRLKKGGDK